jgi:hypothetical protein
VTTEKGRHHLPRHARARGLYLDARARGEHDRYRGSGGGGQRRVMPQTVEAINHRRAAKAPIVVAINK